MHTNNSNSQTQPWYHPPPTHQQPLPLPTFVDPFAMQQLLGLQANSMLCCGVLVQPLYSLPFCVGPVYQGIAQQHQHQHHFRPPNSGQVAINTAKGAARRRLNTHTRLYMNHQERSQEIIPPASIQAWPRWVPLTTQELAGHGDPRQGAHRWLTVTRPSACG